MKIEIWNNLIKNCQNKKNKKQFLLNELTSQTNEQRSLTLEKQKAGLSNWFDNLSKK